MAEAIFKHKTKNIDLDIKVISAGTAVFREDKASNHAVHVMAEKGIDISSHRSRSLDHEMIDRADLILTMTQDHKRAVLNMESQAAEKVFTLKEFVSEHENDSDVEHQKLKLMEEMYQKRNVFLEKHKALLMELKRKQGELLKELNNVEKEIQEWEKRMEKEIEKEKKELKGLQSQFKSPDILDPFGGPVEYYRECVKDIEETVDKLITKLKDNIDKSL